MAEPISIQQLTDASLDVKSLEEVVNGDENVVITTRLGETYPSVKGSIKKVFELGGLPATPFATKALMEASELVDGDYAIVTDDTVNNGLYVKTAGAWVKSGYDPAEQAKSYADSNIEKLSNKIEFGKTANIFNGEFVGGHIASVPSSSLYQYVLGSSGGDFTNATSAIIKIDGGKTYTIRSFSPAPLTTFRILAFKNHPEMIDYPDRNRPEVAGRLVFFDGIGTLTTNTNGIQSCTFTAEADENYILFTASKYEKVKPKLSVVEGTTNDTYQPHTVVVNTKKISSSKELSVLETPDNLFDGYYHRYLLEEANNHTLVYNYGQWDGRTAIIKVKPNTTYTISTPNPTTFQRFRIGLYDNEPDVGTPQNRPQSASSFIDSPSISSGSYTLTTTDATNYIAVYVGNNGSEPLMSVKEGSDAVGYAKNLNIHPIYTGIDKLLSKKSANLFNGKYTNANLTVSGDTATLNKPVIGAKTLVAVVKLDEQTSYTVSAHDNKIPNDFIVALFSGKPTYLEQGGNSSGSVIFNIQGFTSRSFSTSGVTNPYLVIQVGTDNYPRKLQVEKGASATDYKAPFIIPADYLEATKSKDSQSGVYKPLQKYYFVADFDSLYNAPDTLDNYYASPTSVKSADHIARYDAVMARHTGFVTKKKLGTDNHGYDVFVYQTHPADIFLSKSQVFNGSAATNIKLKKPKILITTGIHGNEKSASIGTYYFFKEMLDNPTNNPTLEFIKRNVEIVLIPIVNNSGFSSGSYLTADNININRDFPTAGSITTPETQFVIDVMTEHSDMDFHIDCHTGTGTEGFIGFYFTEVPELLQFTQSMYQAVGNKWRLKYPTLPQNPDYPWVFAANVIDGMAIKYSQDVLGVRSIVIETRDQISGLSTAPHDEYNTRLYLELLVNTIMGCLRLVR